ncbi:MAG: acyl-CoA synthetase FdrA [Promethearchaeota archaeon]
MLKYVIEPNNYRDSIVLMKISRELEEIPNIDQVSVIMATENNLRLLKDIGLYSDEMADARPNDLIIAVSAHNEEEIDEAIQKAYTLLTTTTTTLKSHHILPKTIQAALQRDPELNLALISVAGPFAAREARKALNLGMHVFLFSDNVPINTEVELKTLANEKGLLLMGPDCGTAIINNIALGFANAIQQGSVGVIGASGTGIQQVTTLLSKHGISQAIGTGSRDLTEAVGGRTMLRAISLLDKDPKTKIMVIVSKPPAESIARKVLEHLEKATKPVVVNFLATDPKALSRPNIYPAETLEDAANMAIALLEGKTPHPTIFTETKDAIISLAHTASESLISSQKYVRGVFAGGTFCSEAQWILSKVIGITKSNISSDPALQLKDSRQSEGHTVVDMGEDEFTAGRAHPMIDPRLMINRLLQESKDEETAVLLFDVILGFGAHTDPGVELANTIREIKTIVKKSGRDLPVVATVCGTSSDPQNLERQKTALMDTGVIIMPSNAQAARLATLIASRRRAEPILFGE